MMTCRQLETLIDDYLEGALPPRQRSVFELHLRTCAHCHSYLTAYSQAIAMIREVFSDSDELQEDFPRDFVQAILEEIE